LKSTSLCRFRVFPAWIDEFNPRRDGSFCGAIQLAAQLHVLNISQFLEFEGFYIFDTIDDPTTKLDETRTIADVTPAFESPWADFSPSGQFNLVQTDFSHFRFLSRDLLGRNTTNA
jgi:hypothetical protein